MMHRHRWGDVLGVICTYIVVGTFGYGGYINDVSMEFGLDFLDEEVQVPCVTEWIGAIAGQVKQVFTVVFAAIGHLWPVVQDIPII